ncbi:MAG: SDR family oxidoreductase [Chitinophagales bacterium]|nr:SDR family oxidoreductase [Chitinophagales bacterium]MDW8427946.1 SDR family oxidoreductase [Chitinophagales bacterium]
MNVVITGATRGIGRALTEKFAAEGSNLAVCARTAADLRSLEKDLKDRYPDCELLALPCDVGEKKQIKKFASEVLRHLKAVDVLINNAGLFLPGQLHKEREGIFEQLMRVNVYGPYYLTRLLCKSMIRQRRGHIFNICSTASIQAYPNGGSYSVSKFALLGMTRNLRLELAAFNIKVTAVIPGATLTSSWEGSPHPAQRFMKAQDVAQAVWNAYVLSNQTVVEEIVLRPLEGDL